MAINPRNRKPLRVLAALAALVVALYVLIGSVHVFGTGQLTPKLGLDLEGGTQIILKPQVTGNQTINQSQIDQAVNIMRARVDGSGVSEAEVTTQGGSNIVVSVPGRLDEQTQQSLERASQLRFRAVLCEAAAAPAAVPTPSASGTATATPGASAVPTAVPSAAPSASATASPRTTNGTSRSLHRLPLPRALPAATPTPKTPPSTRATAGTTSPTAKTTPTRAATTPATQAPANPLAACPPAATKAAPTNGSDPQWISLPVAERFASLTCKPGQLVSATVDDTAKPLATCSDDGTTKYALGPAEVTGDQVSDATSGMRLSPQGAPTGEYEVQLKFDGKGTQAFGDVTSRLVSLTPPRNQFGIVLDGLVISAPRALSAITAGDASITGNFTSASAKALADQLKFGALPISFKKQTVEQISPTLGGEQLRRGLLAGALGLLLVVVYSLFQYRALGLVTIASLVIASVITYGLVVLLGWSSNFRLTLAGVTGLIVSIGITADSFIVFFERVRDEVREGRALRAAVEAGWVRARRTILLADGVNLLAAVVLYVLAASNVRGFAYTLGLTTLIDVAVVILFTHPMVVLLANTTFFGQGHRWSGLDPERLGSRTPVYAGRGRVRTPADTVIPAAGRTARTLGTAEGTGR